MRILLLVLLLLPSVAMARVYMCVDPATGTKSFSDTGCDTVAVQEEVRVQVTNLASGRKTGAPVQKKTWVSDRDTRKTGLDYSAQSGDPGAGKATASAADIGKSDDS
ncbi:MAG: DUF4124 domain-containing protein [Pseudomonadales bacterium]|nr:DUF4124 domain-containing protein [Halioglobus sp.]MCP5131007.1 DUF4124 domain-containing protein [Pseudomonadales bacterium]